MFNVNETSLALDRQVRELGWAVQFVGTGEGEPSYCYTVGLLRQYRHPEIVLVGVPPEATQALNALGQQVRDGSVFTPGESPPGVLPGHRTELIAVDMLKSHDELLAAWNLNEEPSPALQLVWPDPRDRLPWEPGYSMPAGAQPLWGRRGEPLPKIWQEPDGSWSSQVPDGEA